MKQRDPQIDEYDDHVHLSFNQEMFLLKEPHIQVVICSYSNYEMYFQSKDLCIYLDHGHANGRQVSGNYFSTNDHYPVRDHFLDLSPLSNHSLTHGHDCDHDHVRGGDHDHDQRAHENRTSPYPQAK